MTDSLSTGTNPDPATERMPHPAIDDAVVAPVPYLAAGLVAAVPLLLIPTSSSPLLVFSFQLSGIVALGLLVTIRIMPLADGEWFTAYGWSGYRRRFSAAVALVVIPTGVVGLVTLATSAALRFTPSLQFLQLLSALDIAWAGAALMIGIRWLWGSRRAYLAGGLLAVVCVLSVWNYLRVVGFGPGGEWVVDASEMLRLVLPFDVAAAVMAVTALSLGIRRSPLDTECADHLHHLEG